MRTIWLDMDGVFADFEFVANSIVGREIGWSTYDLTDEEWTKLQNIPNLYRNLPILPGSTELMEAVLDLQDEFQVKFLTAIPRIKTVPSARQDKVEWAQENFPGIEVEFGPYSQDKWKHAKFLDILIDDRPSNVDEWVTKGNGISIFHKGNNFKPTINHLKKAIKTNTPFRFGNLF